MIMRMMRVAVDIIDQFRLFREVNGDIEKCTGFVFPRRHLQDIEIPTCVTKVDVTFTNLHFCLTITPLQISEVKKEVEAAIEYCKRFIQTEKVLLKQNLITLNQNDLKLLTGEDGAEQVHSRGSLIAKHGSKYYKYIHCIQEQTRLFSIVAMDNPERLTRSLFPIHKHKLKFGNLSPLLVFTYNALWSPLKREEAALCLGYLLLDVIVALDELHDTLVLAHLDVRLENICFRKNESGKFFAVLIDLDRASDDPNSVSSYSSDSCMYDLMFEETGFEVCQMFDWLQLGWMATWVYSGGKGDYHKQDFSSLQESLKNDQCVKRMLKGMNVMSIPCSNYAKILKKDCTN